MVIFHIVPQSSTACSTRVAPHSCARHRSGWGHSPWTHILALVTNGIWLTWLSHLGPLTRARRHGTLLLYKPMGFKFWDKFSYNCCITQQTGVEWLLGFNSFLCALVLDKSLSMCQVQVEILQRSMLHAQCSQSRTINLQCKASWVDNYTSGISLHELLSTPHN